MTTPDGTITQEGPPTPKGEQERDTTRDIPIRSAGAGDTQPDEIFAADWLASLHLRLERLEAVNARLTAELVRCYDQMQHLELIGRLANEECDRWHKRYERVVSERARHNSTIIQSTPETA